MAPGRMDPMPRHLLCGGGKWDQWTAIVPLREEQGSQKQRCPPLLPHCPSRAPLTGPTRDIGCCGAQRPSPRGNLHLVLSARSQRGEACAVHLSTHDAGGYTATSLVHGHLVAVPAPRGMGPGCLELGGAFTGHIDQKRGKRSCRGTRFGEIDRKGEKNLYKYLASLPPKFPRSLAQ